MGNGIYNGVFSDLDFFMLYIHSGSGGEIIGSLLGDGSAMDVIFCAFWGVTYLVDIIIKLLQSSQ